MNSTNKNIPNSSSFEEMSGRLEQIVRQLEGGNVTLVESVKLYEEGAKLAQRCSRLLERAQLKIKQIQEELNQTDNNVSDSSDSTYSTDTDQTPFYE